jgi:OPA family glycerol-3-phosphate transporter-like MFS transporter
LLVGYAGYYVCRSNLSVATPLLLAEGMDKETVGFIASVGVLCYAIGKFVNGIVGDFAGGRRMFLLGMLGSVLATVAFGLTTGLAVWVITWSFNRLVQSMGWGGLVKITARWFSYRQYGQVMGLLSLSYLFGDALARLFLGGLLELGLDWRMMFLAAAALLGVIALSTLVLLRESPQELGLENGAVNPQNLYGTGGTHQRPASLMALLHPFLRSPAFWLVAFLSLGLTLLREAFTFWTPTFLAEIGGLSAAEAGRYSLVFPLAGGCSVLLFGFLSDRLTGGRRSTLMVGALVPLVGVLLAMGLRPATGGLLVPLVLVILAAFLMIGPYSFLAGAISLDLGGQQGSATAAGLVDSAGYFGGLLSGWAVGAVAQRLGWNAVFLALAVVAVLTLIAAMLYGRLERPSPPPSQHHA